VQLWSVWVPTPTQHSDTCTLHISDASVILFTFRRASYSVVCIFFRAPCLSHIFFLVSYIFSGSIWFSGKAIVSALVQRRDCAMVMR
jgi:hypothetical protein